MKSTTFRISIGLFIFSLIFCFSIVGQDKRARDFGLEFGILTPGEKNSLTDVPGVKVGHFTKIQKKNIRTGATAILPHNQNIYQNKIPAAIYIGNGYGKLMGYSQVEELGNIETPIILTNTLSVPTAANALISYTLEQEGNSNVRSVNTIVGETNDGRLNDIRGRHLNENDFLQAIEAAHSGPVAEGNVGAGTGTICFAYKGGIGSSSRVLPKELGGYVVGVLVQSNFGGVLQIDGIPFAKETGRYPYKSALEKSDGSCMIVVITNAPVDARNLKRMAKRAMLGLAKTGGYASNGSGDYVIALSTFKENLLTTSKKDPVYENKNLPNEKMSPLFLATVEATEEAIINSLIAAEDMQGNGYSVKALDLNILEELIKKYHKD